MSLEKDDVTACTDCDGVCRWGDHEMTICPHKYSVMNHFTQIY